jgi:hypothetical protein
MYKYIWNKGDLQAECNDNIYTLNPYNLVYIIGQSCASKTVPKNPSYILGQREYVICV